MKKSRALALVENTAPAPDRTDPMLSQNQTIGTKAAVFFTSWKGLTVLFFAAGFAVFGRIYGHAFVFWDDAIHLYENPYFSPPTFAAIGKFWAGPYAGLYIPTTYSVWTLLAFFCFHGDSANAIERLSPQLFHVFNILLHVTNSLLVYKLLVTLFKAFPEISSRIVKTACAIGALLFLLHPLQVETVAWATGLKDLICTFFSILSLLFFLSFMEHLKPSPKAGGSAKKSAKREKASPDLWAPVAPPRKNGNAWGLLAASSVTYLLALTSKPSAMVLILVAPLLGVMIYRRQITQAALSVALWVPFAFEVISVTRESQAQMITSEPSAWQRPWIMLDSFAFYLKKLVLPFSLGPDYGRRPTELFRMASENPLVYAAILPVLAIGIYLFINGKKKAVFQAIAGFYILSLLPTSGLISFGYQNYSTVADHYIYFGFISISFLVAIGISSLILKPAREKFTLVAALVLLITSAVLSHLQVTYWMNTKTLFEHNLTINSRSWASETNIGLFLEKNGKIAESLDYFKRALVLNPDNEDAENDIGFALINLGRFQEIIPIYTDVLSRKPYYAGVRSNLGIAYEALNQYPEAAAQYEEAIKLRPSFVEAHYNLADVLRKLGRTQEAADQYREALKYNPYLTVAQQQLEATLKEGAR
jgi:tetratricopeptide (TPR) repeat protein